MTAVTILHEAEVELWNAVAFYEIKAPGLGLDFAGEIEKSVQVIRRSPEIRPLRDDGTRRYINKHFPYIIVYIYLSNHIWIVAIAHCKRRPGYWKSRL